MTSRAWALMRCPRRRCWDCTIGSNWITSCCMNVYAYMYVHVYIMHPYIYIYIYQTYTYHINASHWACSHAEHVSHTHYTIYEDGCVHILYFIRGIPSVLSNITTCSQVYQASQISPSMHPRSCHHQWGRYPRRAWTACRMQSSEPARCALKRYSSSRSGSLVIIIIII